MLTHCTHLTGWMGRTMRCIGFGVLALALPVAAKTPVRQSSITFTTPEEAVQATVRAAENNDTAALLKIFGHVGRDIVESGDSAEDKSARSEFARLAHEKTQVHIDPANPDKAAFSVGDEAWPFPVPLVRINGKWEFDSAQGRVAILAHRIGENELDVIEVCRGFVEAELEYASADHDGTGILAYAQKVVSSPAKQDGLYWQRTPDSPVSKAFANATAESLNNIKALMPYHGYYFRILKSQGPDAPGGAFEYVVNGKMIGGFALIAWPAKYLVSGVQTFIINHDGIVYQKDLGPDTPTLVNRITQFEPDQSWHPVME